LNEIRILASIKHRNIIRYCDAFTEKDNLYIVMEFAEHGDIGRQARALRAASSSMRGNTGPSAQIEKFKKANKYIKEDTIWSYAIQIAFRAAGHARPLHPAQGHQAQEHLPHGQEPRSTGRPGRCEAHEGRISAHADRCVLETRLTV